MESADAEPAFVRDRDVDLDRMRDNHRRGDGPVPLGRVRARPFRQRALRHSPRGAGAHDHPLVRARSPEQVSHRDIDRDISHHHQHLLGGEGRAGLVEIGRAYSASESQIFFKIVLPAAVPFIMAGVRLSAGSGSSA